MLALAEIEADACSGCGHPLSESTQPRMDGRYVAPLATRCYACTAIAERSQDYQKDGVRAPSALLLHAEKRA